MFGQMAKWVAKIDRADRVPEYISRAFHTAVSGRPGPVVLALPEDMQSETASVAVGERYQRVAAAPRPSDMEKLRDMLAKAERPFVAVGGAYHKAVQSLTAGEEPELYIPPPDA